MGNARIQPTKPLNYLYPRLDRHNRDTSCVHTVEEIRRILGITHPTPIQGLPNVNDDQRLQRLRNSLGEFNYVYVEINGIGSDHHLVVHRNNDRVMVYQSWQDIYTIVDSPWFHDHPDGILLTEFFDHIHNITTRNDDEALRSVTQLFGASVGEFYNRRNRPHIQIVTIGTMQDDNIINPQAAMFGGIYKMGSNLELRSSNGDVLHDDHGLKQGYALKALNKEYYAVMQPDGNFVVYQGSLFVQGNAIWASNTQFKGTGPYHLDMQKDGNLVIYDKDNKPTWASLTYNKGQNGYRLVMQDDRNLVLYDGTNKALWASNTQAKG